MTDAELWAAWRLWLGVGVVIVLVAAALLIAIWLTARQILADAGRALAAAEAIREKTSVIWGLQQSNEVAADLLETVRGIEGKTRSLAETLQSHAGATGQ